jgi:hypothetical protein
MSFKISALSYLRGMTRGRELLMRNLSSTKGRSIRSTLHFYLCWQSGRSVPHRISVYCVWTLHCDNSNGDCKRIRKHSISQRTCRIQAGEFRRRRIAKRSNLCMSGRQRASAMPFAHRWSPISYLSTGKALVMLKHLPGGNAMKGACRKAISSSQSRSLQRHWFARLQMG